MQTKYLLLLALFTSCVQGATLTFDNIAASGDAAYGIRGDNGTLVTTANGYTGVLGRFTIADSAVTNNFNNNNFAGIQAGFSAFDPVNGTFALDSFGPGAFQASESFDTKASSNTFGGSSIYAVFYKGSSIGTATEMFIAKLNSVFPTDPEVGLALTASTSLTPSNVSSILVGRTGAPHDFGLGGGALPTYQLSAVPEPSRTMILGAGLFGLFAVRNRRRKPMAI